MGRSKAPEPTTLPAVVQPKEEDPADAGFQPPGQAHEGELALAAQRRQVIARHATPERVDEMLEALFKLGSGQYETERTNKDGSVTKFKNRPDIAAARLYLAYAVGDPTEINRDPKTDDTGLSLTREQLKKIEEIVERYGGGKAMMRVIKVVENVAREQESGDVDEREEQGGD